MRPTKRVWQLIPYDKPIFGTVPQMACCIARISTLLSKYAPGAGKLSQYITRHSQTSDFAPVLQRC